MVKYLEVQLNINQMLEGNINQHNRVNSSTFLAANPSLSDISLYEGNIRLVQDQSKTTALGEVASFQPFATWPNPLPLEIDKFRVTRKNQAESFHFQSMLFQGQCNAIRFKYDSSNYQPPYCHFSPTPLPMHWTTFLKITRPIQCQSNSTVVPLRQDNVTHRF